MPKVQKYSYFCKSYLLVIIALGSNDMPFQERMNKTESSNNNKSSYHISPITDANYKQILLFANRDANQTT